MNFALSFLVVGDSDTIKAILELKGKLLPNHFVCGSEAVVSLNIDVDPVSPFYSRIFVLHVQAPPQRSSRDHTPLPVHHPRKGTYIYVGSIVDKMIILPPSLTHSL